MCMYAHGMSSYVAMCYNYIYICTCFVSVICLLQPEGDALGVLLLGEIGEFLILLATCA